MTTIESHLGTEELEARYETASDPIAKSHFHALWLLSKGYDLDEVAELLSFSTRWVYQLVKRYNAGGPDFLGDQRAHNGTEPTIVTPEALSALKERIKTPPDDGGLWSGPKVARWLCSEASCHSSGCKSRQQRSPVTVVVISSDGEGDRTVESLEVKVPEGWGVPVRSVQGGEQTGRP
jgi:Homeodomain-like domain-containing protein